ncbi:hypothetical protein [Candidatus Nucleicultrix amoebiphila]|jgi:hypothetical protein|uniref:Uncharacterized protein n=1 Tax=Candidatus Nucleicultrix amoebiphila FS5 TaxID=1414854 RepID=A0A1W6N5D2_9PROT|nr:hypothetical protein [Candidatus Nucleicultrix amoebiphila]ARN85011.1 hypothetical protein GQ61_06590 [Candidatus Nucleicultrix amoebiphila FS5]
MQYISFILRFSFPLIWTIPIYAETKEECRAKCIASYQESTRPITMQTEVKVSREWLEKHIERKKLDRLSNADKKVGYDALLSYEEGFIAQPKTDHSIVLNPATASLQGNIEVSLDDLKKNLDACLKDCDK